MVRLLGHTRFFVRWGRAVRIIFWTSFVALLFPIIAALWLFYYINYSHSDFNDRLVDNFLSYHPPLITEILYRDGEFMMKFPGIGDWDKRIPEYRKWVSFEETPEIVRNAIYSAEDQRFLTNSGLDYRGMARAILENGIETLRSFSRTGKFKPVFAVGASTLTQQAIELTLLSDDHEKKIKGQISHKDKFFLKIDKMRLSVWLEGRLREKFGVTEAKHRIFEVVQNASYCGHGQYGVSSAAAFFFGKSLSELNPGEAAMIASLFRSPEKYSPYRNLSLSMSRRNGVLRVMENWGYISYSDFLLYSSESPKLVVHEKQRNEAPAAIQHVLRELWSNGTSSIKWKNGAKVVTTIDKEAQKIANDSVGLGLWIFKERQLRHAEDATNDNDGKFFRNLSEKIQGAMVVLQNGTGEIIAMVGGDGTEYMSFNRATEALRQPGSAFKTFVYGTALERGDDFFRIDCLHVGSGKCRISDSPISVKMGRNKPRHTISNYDGRVFGSLPIWVAFARSQNMAAMHLARNLGIQNVIDFANRLGLNLNGKVYPTAAIGTEEVTVLNLTAAYSVFPTFGIYVKPHITRSVIQDSGESLDSTPEFKQVVDSEVALNIVQLLRHPVLYRSGTARALNEEGYPILVAGKTGTTNNYRDAWFCGFTYGLDGVTACAWVGMDDRSPLATGKNETLIHNENQRCSPLHPVKRDYCEAGGKTALPIVKFFMQEFYRGKSIPEFPEGMDDWVRYVHDHDRDPTLRVR